MTNKYYERFMIEHKDNNLDTTLHTQVKDVKLALKDTYLFDFLELNEEHSEQELHEGLLGKLRQCLLEL
jgi:predicted nuclease of restriction endonuclease-like (RecB) superfamily